MINKHPDIETIVNNVHVWIDKNYIRTVARYPLGQENRFKWSPGIIKISKIWHENDYWVVDTTTQFMLPSMQTAKITFQINDNAEVVGFNYNNP
jgi:hypothetical protein